VVELNINLAFVLPVPATQTLSDIFYCLPFNMPDSPPDVRQSNDMMDHRYFMIPPLQIHLSSIASSESSEHRYSCALHHRDQLALLSGILDQLKSLHTDIDELREAIVLYSSSQDARTTPSLEQEAPKDESSNNSLEVRGDHPAVEHRFLLTTNQ
jgi:hypothetical protein